MFSHLFRNISIVCPRYTDEYFRFIGIIVNHLRIFIDVNKCITLTMYDEERCMHIFNFLSVMARLQSLNL